MVLGWGELDLVSKGLPSAILDVGVISVLVYKCINIYKCIVLWV